MLQGHRGDTLGSKALATTDCPSSLYLKVLLLRNQHLYLENLLVSGLASGQVCVEVLLGRMALVHLEVTQGH